MHGCFADLTKVMDPVRQEQCLSPSQPSEDLNQCALRVPDVILDTKELAQHRIPLAVKLRPVLYGLVNGSSAVAIVMANKVVLYTYDFHFPVALTLIHMIATAVGMRVLAWCAFFEKKPIPFLSSMQLAGANVGSIVFNNLSLQWNTVSFYQVANSFRLLFHVACSFIGLV